MNAPLPSPLLTDRGRQALYALAAGLRAPRTLRTRSRDEALQWMQRLHGPAALSPPDLDSTPHHCPDPAALLAIWDQMAAAVGPRQPLVLQAWLPGTQYTVCVLPGPEDVLMRSWFGDGRPLPARGMLHRALALHANRARNVLHAADRPLRCRFARDADGHMHLLWAKPLHLPEGVTP
ncbi:hypothetical protein ABZ705_28145 [Streptomyces sp. NPDC006984]|uniref:hypothetical protein n=1 Tax=Streptomyces sp. NPDC006984 TaxID=3155463 RepID=UPI0033E1E33B